MNIKICDVCFKEKETAGKMEQAWGAVSYKSGAKKIKVDVCSIHKPFFRGLSFAEAEEKVNKLYGF